MGDCNSGALLRRNRPREVGWNHFRSSTKTDGQSTVEIRESIRLASTHHAEDHEPPETVGEHSRQKAVNTFAIVVGFATRNF